MNSKMGEIGEPMHEEPRYAPAPLTEPAREEPSPKVTPPVREPEKVPQPA